MQESTRQSLRDVLGTLTSTTVFTVPPNIDYWPDGLASLDAARKQLAGLKIALQSDAAVSTRIVSELAVLQEQLNQFVPLRDHYNRTIDSGGRLDTWERRGDAERLLAATQQTAQGLREVVTAALEAKSAPTPPDTTPPQPPAPRVPDLRRYLAAVGYAFVAFFSLAVVLAVGNRIIDNPRLTGLTADRAYYVLLVVLGISAAFFLFGILRSRATLRGEPYGLAIELGGPAACAACVVLGGFVFAPPEDKPEPTFTLVVRLRYGGPLADERAYLEALPNAKLLVTVGSGTTASISINANGEAAVTQVPSQFRDGNFTFSIPASERIKLLDVPQPVKLRKNEDVVELRAALREDTRVSRLKELKAVLEAARGTTIRSSERLIPMVDQYLQKPSPDVWDAVLKEQATLLKDVLAGVTKAIEYESSYGELGDELGHLRLVLERSPSPPLVTSDLIQQWNGRENVLVRVPRAGDVQKVAEWRRELEVSNKSVIEVLNALIDSLKRLPSSSAT